MPVLPPPVPLSKTATRIGRPPKLTKPEPEEHKSWWELPWLEKANPLSKSEFSNFREPLKKGFEAFWMGLDQFISNTNARKTDVIIWQSIEEAQTYALVDRLLASGAKSIAAAQAVRVLAGLYEQYEIGIILLPRFTATWAAYAKNGGFRF